MNNSQYDASTRASFWPQSVLIVIYYHKTPIPGRIELIEI